MTEKFHMVVYDIAGKKICYYLGPRSQRGNHLRKYGKYFWVKVLIPLAKRFDHKAQQINGYNGYQNYTQSI